MIKSLLLQNLESHVDTFLEFPDGPGLTVFIGDSDRGKSGSFRGFNWARDNSPLGDWMRPLYWDGESRVRVEFTGGEVIERLKSNGVNDYVISVNGESTRINAGTKVPQQVQDVFRMGETSFQYQIDRAFLMFTTPGERGRILNQITGLEKIDTTSRNADSDVKFLKKEKHRTREEITVLKTQLEGFTALPRIKELLEQADILQRLIQQKTSILKRGERLIQEREILIKKMISSHSMSWMKELMERAGAKSKDIERDGRRLNKIRTLVEKRQEIQKGLTLLGQTIPLMEKAKDLAHEVSERREILNSFKYLTGMRESLTQISEENQVRLRKLKKKIPRTCPECGSVLGGKIK